VALSDELYRAALKRLHDGVTGSVMAKAEKGETDLKKLFAAP
jgi:hypothetical protein